ncbi:low molecular weight phosphatase family protein [Mycetocola zhadangensis]|uniref:arsenate reductase/protein-tyrosine-phosphatase family protein n=1 Tax=Mycetocola zhadangensis TaxID=1164595 RepID=UPI001FD4528E|nr:low molecular weight phosphatase family protein [Mycetocola zhadangensis]
MSDFSILTVCSGNICRSPMAEQLLRTGLAQHEGIRVSSAGTVGLIGHPMDAQAAALAAQLGVTDTGSHIARELDAPIVGDAQLVFAMAREHRRAVVELEPRAARRTFTIREFARIVTEITDDDLAEVAALPATDAPARLSAAVAVVASMRGMVDRPASPEDDDVIDPYRRTADVYERSASELRPAVNAVVAFTHRVLSL